METNISDTSDKIISIEMENEMNLDDLNKIGERMLGETLKDSAIVKVMQEHHDNFHNSLASITPPSNFFAKNNNEIEDYFSLCGQLDKMSDFAKKNIKDKRTLIAFNKKIDDFRTFLIKNVSKFSTDI